MSPPPIRSEDCYSDIDFLYGKPTYNTDIKMYFIHVNRFLACQIIICSTNNKSTYGNNKYRYINIADRFFRMEFFSQIRKGGDLSDRNREEEEEKRIGTIGTLPEIILGERNYLLRRWIRERSFSMFN